MNRESLRASAVQTGKLLLISALLLPAGSVAARAGQISQTNPPGNVGRPQPPGAGVDEPSPLAGINGVKMEHLREDERRKRMLADTARLVTLSTELNAEVQKTTRDELSVEVVRKAAEIEKLAHDVRERMRS